MEIKEKPVQGCGRDSLCARRKNRPFEKKKLVGSVAFIIKKNKSQYLLGSHECLIYKLVWVVSTVDGFQMNCHI